MIEVSSVPGSILIILITSVAAAYPLSLLFVWLYKRAAARRTRSKAAVVVQTRPIAGAAPTPFGGSIAELREELRRAPYRAAVLQGSVALVLAIYLAVLLLHATGVAMSVFRLVLLTATLFWPGVLAIFLTGGIARRQRLRILIVAAVAYGVCGIVASLASPGTAVRQVATLWAILNLPFTFVLAAILARHIRGIGPSVFLVTVVALSGPGALFHFLWRDPDTAMSIGRVLMFDVGLEPGAAIGVLVLAGAAIAGLCGVWLLRRLGTAYEKGRVAGESITLSALWLVYVTIFAGFTLFFEGSTAVVFGLAAFPLYLSLICLGRRLFLKHKSGPGPLLLLLRVFWDTGRTPTLFRVASRHWRHVGPIAILGGTDLASAALELDEFMAFLRRDLSSVFVADPAATLERLTASSARRDADGRFRCQQRWCFPETWKDTVTGLIARSAVVLVDVRSLGDKAVHLERIKTESGRAHDARIEEGIDFELTTLKALHALDRSVLIHDGSGVLEKRLDALGIDSSSVRRIRLTGDESADVSLLLDELPRHCFTTARENGRAPMNAAPATAR